ncbi:hypothetical protein ACPOLB_23660 [Rubrivivax sp. RP6-9]|uniref:hypothetical protein n=1 Tax=Rubrivivax sp. RP6-9 TaxID=3415750 RepID=UPI003CC554AB
MTNRSRTAASIVFIVVCAAIGGVAAKLSGVTSWPDAKLYLLVGVAAGAVVAELVHRISGVGK